MAEILNNPMAIGLIVVAAALISWGLASDAMTARRNRIARAISERRAYESGLMCRELHEIPVVVPEIEDSDLAYFFLAGLSGRELAEDKVDGAAG